MNKIKIETTFTELFGDVYTPVSVYLRLRDKFRDTILLESADYHAAENSFSIIGVHAIAGVELKDDNTFEQKFPGSPAKAAPLHAAQTVPQLMKQFMDHFEVCAAMPAPVNIAQGIFGYTAFDAVRYFEDIDYGNATPTEFSIPKMRYRFYQYVIVFNHFKDSLFVCENKIDGVESNIDQLMGIIKSKDVPQFPFSTTGGEVSSQTDESYLQNVKDGIAACHRGDVFQIVLSRRFKQKFKGDEFNVYRALRRINPSPYLFYFDYGDYKLAGSSPESQVLINGNEVTLYPIAGTIKRSGNELADRELANTLLADEKESAEHVMLVDLARNDLSRLSSDVHVNKFKEVQYFSHVIHLVSEVKGTLPPNTNPFDILGTTFPAGTLSGAPKYKALQLINAIEQEPRGFYGGTIGFIGFDGSCNHAIMIRSFLSKNNSLVFQAGAGVVAASIPQNELEEVNNKLGALKAAILLATTINK